MSDYEKLLIKYDCPGPQKCDKAQANALGAKLFHCRDCKAPAFIYAPDGTKVYRSYADYCDD